MSTNLPFPLADFYDALVAKNLKQRLEPFIAQFRKKNIYIIYECVNRLIQIITNKSQLPIMKFNALMATRYFFDTCEYAAIVFIQVYMLPVIYEIAVQKYLKRSEEGIELYFVDRGAENNKEMRRLGLNYVQLAVEFVFNSAKVKPYRLVQNRQLKEESNFARMVKVLTNKGIQQPQKCTYFIPSYPALTRKKFIKKLKHISPEPYISFIVSEYLEEINLNKKCDLDIKKLLLFGDSFLTSTIVEIIQEELSNMASNFINKKKYLNLLNDLIRSGEIESIYLVNTADFVRDIAEQISKVKGELGPQQGEYIFPKIQASKQQKKEFYIQFLRVLEIWAFCMPSTDEGQESDIARIYEQLKKKGFAFPKNVILKKIKAEMDQNLIANQERNDTLMRIIDEDDRASSRNAGSYVSSKGQFKFHFPQYKQKASYLELDQLQYKVFQTKKKLARLTLRREELDDNLKAIQQFVENWEEDLEKLDIEDEDPHQLQILVDEGDQCCEMYGLIVELYQQLNEKKISFQNFVKKVEVIENAEPQEASFQKSSHMKHSKQASEISMDRKFHQPSVKPSSMSQSVRKHIQDQYYVQYGHHYTRQQSVKNQKLKDSYDMKDSMKESRQMIETRQVNKQNVKDQMDDSYAKESKISKKSKQLKSAIRNLQASQKNSQSKMSSRLSQSQKYEVKQQKSSVLVQNAKSPQKQQQYIMSLKGKQNVYGNPMKKLPEQHSDEKSSQQISVSDKSSQSQPEPQQSPPRQQAIKRNPPRTQKAAPIAFGSSGSDFHPPAKQPQSKKPSKQPKRKSHIKHSVISKSSYHSQPTQTKLLDPNPNQGNSVMNDYQYQANNYQKKHNNNDGITIKKSSIKRTQNSAMKSSSHKRLPEQRSNINGSKAPMVEAVSPFKKKESPSREVRIKDSYVKQYEFVKTAQKPTRQIDQNITYEDVFRRRDQTSLNQSQISSQSQSVLIKRNRKQAKHQAMRQTARINLNDESQYYNQTPQQTKKSTKMVNNSRKDNQKTPQKNLIMFDSKHQTPTIKSNKVDKVHEDYDIRYESNVKNFMPEKGSEMSKVPSSRFQGSKVKNSGIKLISKNDHKSFDSLYKNQHVPLGDNNNKRYQQVSSVYNTGFGQSRSPGTKFLTKPNPNNSSIIQNPDYSPVSLQQINQQIQRFKNKPTRHNDASQIHEPENMPMLYSYCSEKSIHSKITDSHTRKGNLSSGYNEFKVCYLNMDKQILPLNLTKSKAVSSSFSVDKARNFIDFRGSNAKSYSKVNTVVDAISEKNAKNSILLYKLQRQKTRLVENLQNKIKTLEVNGKMMKTKYAVKDLQGRQFSQRQLNLRQVKTSRQSSNQQNNSFHELTVGKRNMEMGASRKNIQIGENEEGLFRYIQKSKATIVNLKPYEAFFSQFVKASPSKKQLLKKKGLLIKNDQIQIGYMLTRKQKQILISIFITPQLSSLKNVTAAIQCDHSLSHKTKPSKIQLIQAKKQQLIICSFTVQNLPFKVPVVTIKFDANRAYTVASYRVGLPCTLLAVVGVEGDVAEEVGCAETYCSNVFRYNRKGCKVDKLKELIGAVRETKVGDGSQRLTRLESTVGYNGLKVKLGVVINQHGSAIIQATSLNSTQPTTSDIKFIQYLISTLKFTIQQPQQ